MVPRSALTPRPGAGLALLAALIGCDRGAEPARSDAIPTDSLIVTLETTPSLPNNDATGAQAWLGPTHLLVIPMQEAMVIRIPLGAGRIDTIGRQGAGPGEFRYPTSAWMRADTLLVYDRTLARLQTFLPDGTVLRESRVAMLPEEVQGGRDTFDIANLPTPTGFGFLMDREGAGRAPLEGRGGDARPRMDYVAAGGRGRYFVYEAAAGGIHTFDATGEQLFVSHHIPQWLFTRLVAFSAALDRELGVRPEPGGDYAPKIKGLAGDGEGRVIIYYVTNDPEDGYAVRFDPERGTFTRLGYPADPAQRAALRQAFGMSALGDRLAVTRVDGTWLFRIADAP